MKKDNVKFGDKLWIVPNRNKIGGVLIEELLKNRYGDDIDIAGFLDPKFELADPFLMKDMGRSVKRIWEAIQRQENITVFADYDADGVTSAALLWECFRFLGVEVEVYIPDRVKEGYGLRYNSLSIIRERGTDLLITVDCGIRDGVVIKKMNDKGLDIVVTDHHEVGEKIPDCEGVINPKREGDMYPQKDLAGVGVAYTLVRALLKESKKNENEIEHFLKWHLDLVAIGTIADMVPLVGENRIIAKYGLKTLSKTRRKGLRKMFELLGSSIGDVSSFDVGYMIGPRLNAAGRLDHAMSAFNVLTENEELELEVIVNNLHSCNQKRRLITEEIYNNVVGRVGESGISDVILFADEKWPRGVVGLVSSRIAENYCRPTFIAEIDGDMVVGSGRSVDGISVVDVLEKANMILMHYGGHELAGGFSLKYKNWEEFKKIIEKEVAKKIEKLDLRKKIYIDIVVETCQLNWDVWREIKQIEPFGMKNEEPVLMLEGVDLINMSKVGKEGDHLKMIWQKDHSIVKSMWWNMGVTSGNFYSGEKYDLAFKIRDNEYKGNKELYLDLVDVRKSNTL